MNLLVLNGSPRGSKGNTQILLDEFTSGFGSNKSNSSKIALLNQTRDHQELATGFWDSDLVLIGYPLYVDSMPARVKLFIEKVGEQMLETNEKHPTIAFLVQSGFTEASHSRRVEKYHVKLAKRLNCFYAGTIVKGGCEGLRLMPEWSTRGTRQRVKKLGEEFQISTEFDQKILDKLAKPEKLGAFGRAIIALGSYFGFGNWYWDMNLKKNNSFENRNDAPYQGRWPGKRSL